MAALPVDAEKIRGFAGSEDFAFDLDGSLVHVNPYGGLVRETREGNDVQILPGLGFVSGLRILPGGDIALNSVDTNTILRVTPAGESRVLLAGLNYPNGLELGMDGFLYVAENGSTRVRRVDPDTGEYTVIADGLFSPNGVAFDATGERLFVGSFGGGIVYAVDRVDELTWERPRVYATGLGVSPPVEPCTGLGAGESCSLLSGGEGSCVDDGGDLYCTLDLDTESCEGRLPGDACTTTVFGETIESECVADPGGSGDPFCSSVDVARIHACEDGTLYGDCRFGLDPGYCVTGWEGPLVCVTMDEYQSAYLDGCVGKDDGDACEYSLPSAPGDGTCTAYEGYDDLYCMVGPANGGGYDGVGADACGNVYVSEYLEGKVWRWSAEGAEPELVSQLDSTWIPNLHWGLGVGGWERDTMYVMNLDGRGIFEVPVSVLGKPDAYEALSAAP
jgi:sugar lactone lactonase YvrE